MTTDDNDLLAYNLADLLTSLGELAQTSSWRCSGIEAYGGKAVVLETYSDKQQPILGQELFHIVSSIDSIVDGYFRAYHQADLQPWLVVRVIDSNVFEIEAHDPIVDRIKQDLKNESVRMPPLPSPAPTASKQIAKSTWNPVAYAEEMRKSTLPVSAFFLIDSLESISKCIRWLSLLEPYGMPDMEHSQYFMDVQKIFESNKEVINFDHEFNIYWESKKFQALLRCHLVDQGRYEIELWLPGLLANDVADKFKDGREGFFCAFMPPLFYD